jgi:hypothetical protein
LAWAAWGPEEEKNAGETRRRAGRAIAAEGRRVKGLPFLPILFFLRVRAAVVATRRGEERQRRSVPARRRRLRDSSCERVRVDVDQALLLFVSTNHGFDPNPHSRFRSPPA